MAKIHRKMIKIHRKEDLKKMHAAGHLAASVLDYVAPFVKEGVSTLELDQLCHEFILSQNAIPASLNYEGFPNAVCTSLNNVVCHGIPGPQRLKSGDIINIDVAVRFEGWYGDTSRTFPVGEISSAATKLIQVTHQALMQAIAIIRPGITLGDVGYCIQSVVEPHGFSVVHDYCGHGIGRKYHDEPQVLHYGTPRSGIRLREGMFFTVEPMINEGIGEILLLEDGWTAVTQDFSLSAQFEHSVGVTSSGVEIFTT
jgi:methionyl aminopeptidase